MMMTSVFSKRLGVCILLLAIVFAATVMADGEEAPEMTEEEVAEMAERVAEQESLELSGGVLQYHSKLPVARLEAGQYAAAAVAGDWYSGGFSLRNDFNFDATVHSAWSTLVYGGGVAKGADAVADRYRAVEYGTIVSQDTETTFFYPFRVHKDTRPGSYMIVTYANVTRDLTQSERATLEDQAEAAEEIDFVAPNNVTYTLQVSLIDLDIEGAAFDTGKATVVLALLVAGLLFAEYIYMNKTRGGAFAATDTIIGSSVRAITGLASGTSATAGGTGSEPGTPRSASNSTPRKSEAEFLAQGTAMEAKRSRSGSRSGSGSRNRSRNAGRR